MRVPVSAGCRLGSDRWVPGPGTTSLEWSLGQDTSSFGNQHSCGRRFFPSLRGQAAFGGCWRQHPGRPGGYELRVGLRAPAPAPDGRATPHRLGQRKYLVWDKERPVGYTVADSRLPRISAPSDRNTTGDEKACGTPSQWPHFLESPGESCDPVTVPQPMSWERNARAQGPHLHTPPRRHPDEAKQPGCQEALTA